MWINESGFLAFANPFYEGLFINFCVFILSYIAAKVSRERYVYLIFEESRLCSKERMTVEASFFQELTLFYLWKYAKTKKAKKCLFDYWLFWIAFLVLSIGFFFYAYEVISRNEITYFFWGYCFIGLYLLFQGDLISSNKLR